MKSRVKEKSWFGTGNYSRLAVAAVFGWSTTIYPVLAETLTPPVKQAQSDSTPAPAEEAPAAAPALPDKVPGAAQAQAAATPDDAADLYTVTDLQYLLGPIALYPDPLLSLVLSASTSPFDQLIKAEDWLNANPKAAEAGDFAEAEKLGLDAPVVALLRFPDVIEMLVDHEDWTESLGFAFDRQPEDVTTVIQLLRAQAEKLGNLKTTPQQVVTVQEATSSAPRVISIAPAQPERIYVPVYNSSDVFTTAATGALIFGTAVLVGSAWNNSWGWNNRGWNNVWVTHHWHGAPGWRPGPPHRPRPPGAWQPERPNRPDRPNRPGRPDNGRPGDNNRPGRPGDNNRPGRPGDNNNRPGRPGDNNRPNRPGTENGRPNRPGTETGRPNRPERPGTETGRPNRPNARPERPGSDAGRPNRPERPAGTRPNRPETGRPGAENRPNRPNRPETTRPSRPENARPQQRPSQNARPQQRPSQNARPQQRPNQNARPQQRPNQNARPQQRPSQNARPQQRPGQNARPQQRARQHNQNRNRPQQHNRNRNCRPGQNNCR